MYVHMNYISSSSSFDGSIDLHFGRTQSHDGARVMNIILTENLGHFIVDDFGINEVGEVAVHAFVVAMSVVVIC